MIGVVVRELTFLKVLQPIMDELHDSGAKYILYHFDAPRGNKEYNRATLEKIKQSSTRIVKNAHKVKAFPNDKQLLKQFVHDKITKLVSLEVYLWAKGYLKQLKQNNIKIYSILYLTDSLWQPSPECITAMDRVYYTSEYIKSTHLDFLGIKGNPRRDRTLGNPIYNNLMNKVSDGKDVLVMLPNLRAEHVPVSFGSKENFVKIIKTLADGNNLIFKTRKKQWLPAEIKQYAKEIIDDGDEMFPASITKAFRETHTTVMFYSSGIYEAVYAGNYVVNIPLPLKRWGWDKGKMKEYFSTEDWNLYNFRGVVESVTQKEILSGSWKLKKKDIDIDARIHWISKFIGSVPMLSEKVIVKDILCG